MKFKFNLEKVLQHRKILENTAQVDYQEALAQLHIEERALQNLYDDIEQARTKSYEIQTGSSSLSTPGLLQKTEEFIVGQGFRIVQQKLKIAEAEKLVEARREILRTRAVDSKILEKLKEKLKAEQEKEAIRQEQLQQDEMALMRFRLKED